jgi:hypothetical protein
MKKRKKIEDLILGLFKALDRKGKNPERYASFFKKMNDTDFEKWAKSFFTDEDENFFLDCIPYQTEPSMKDIEKAAAFLKLPLKETVSFNHLDGVKTKSPVPVGYLSIKRHQQIISKKNNLSSGIRRRNQKTGQVIGDSKAARLTDMDNYALQTINANAALSELLGPRADDMKAKNRMYEQIREFGFVSQESLKSNAQEKVTLNTLNVLMIGAGIQTDLVNKTLLLPITADTVNRQEKQAARRTVQGVK